MVGSGNSTFCKKRRLRKWKTPKNQYLYFYSILKTEKRKPFFNFQSPLWKLEKSAPFSHEKPDIFKIFLRYKVKQLSWVIFISHESQKNWKETFLEFFLLFAFFFKVKQSRPFSSFFVWSFWADSCQIKAGIPFFTPLNSPLNWQLWAMNCERYVSVKSKLQHAPPGNPPGIWLFWNFLLKFPPTRAKMPFKCPTLGSIQVIKCPHPGDILQAQKWQKDIKERDLTNLFD